MRRLIIAGSRELCKFHGPIVARAAERFVAAYFRPDVVLSGACKGADELGEQWAQSAGIPLERHPANWKRGRGAGPERNQLMVSLADGLVVVRATHSRGSQDVLERAQRKGIPIVDVVLPSVVILRGEKEA